MLSAATADQKARARSFVETLLKTCADSGASDVHFHSNELVRMRKHLTLHAITDRAVPSVVIEAALSAMLKPEDAAQLVDTGQVDGGLSIEGVGRFRVSAYRQLMGTDVVFRILRTSPPTLFELNLPQALARLTTFHQGIVLCTGPAGSGKSATLAALVHMINEERAEHVITIEDPIEVLHSSLRCIVNQRQAGRHTASFSRALKAALREDPDVIVIGEMRDRETASLALTAAETGHLVLATLHTHSAIRTINRVIGEFPPSQQGTIRAMLSESLRAVVSQRLLPNRAGDAMIPALEILYATPAVQNLIRDNRTHQIRSVMQTSGAHGMQTMDAALADLVKREIIGVDEAMKHVDDPRALGLVPTATQRLRLDTSMLDQEMP